MPEITAPRVVYFGRFSLDLARGCLRVSDQEMGDQEIELRPKAFEVLKHLAENAGRLIAKQELYDAIWPNVIVSDDSIAQCISELRSKLGDDNHSLIKTVSRRGYLFDTTVTAEASQRLPDGAAAVVPGAPQAQRASQAANASTVHGPRAWAAVATCFLIVVWGATYLLGTPSLIGSRHVPRAQQLGFQDCEICPEMVTLPAGDFLMGSPASEIGHLDVEGLPRHVAIPKRIAIGKYEVTVDQMSVFTAETGITVGASCHVIADPSRTVASWSEPDASLQHPGFEITGSHPAVCISWHEAQAYVAWLQRHTGKPYRLPTESEWEYAARAGTKTRYSFGSDETVLCAYARFADLASQFGWRDGCRSALVAYGPAPVGSFKPNPWGLFDMHGNVWEWVEDCWTPHPQEIPIDGSAFSRPKNCEMGVTRGGSFAAGSRRVRSAIRSPMRAAKHFYHTGFRVALTLAN